MRECCYKDKTWKVLIVDDEVDVLSVTKLALFDFKHMNRGLEFIEAKSKTEAILKLQEHQDIAVAFIDIIMEEKDSGLKLVKYIRDDLNNYMTRIVIRTGQPGEYPERELIQKYEINDYKSKDELTEDKLFCTMTTALRAFCDLYMLDYYKDIEQRMIEHSKLSEMGEMIGIIAHQWKQPLSLIAIYVDELEFSIEEDKLDNKRAAECIKNVIGQVQYMSNTVNDFINFLKPRNTKKSSFKLKDVLNSISNMLNSILKKQSIEYIENIEKDYILNGYDSELKQALINLIINAQDSILEKNMKNGYIKIDVKEVDKNIIISVEDDGARIDESLLPDKLFENHISTKGEKGSGMGLYITKYIIERNFKGSISAKNNENSSIFIIKIPLEF